MIFYFPQWQGSFENNRLLSSAAILRKYIENTFGARATFVDIPLESSASFDLVDGILACDAIIKQANNAQALLNKLQPDRVFTLGGDCGIEVMPVTYLNEKYAGNFAAIWFDAHADLNTPASSPSHTFHGMPLRVILGEGDATLVQHLPRALSPQQEFFFGVREFDPPERAYVEQQAIPTISLDTIAERLADYDNVYIHFDVDAFDPQTFSSTDYPTPGGLTMETALQTLHTIAVSANIVGMSITEYSSETGQGLETLMPLLAFFVSASQSELA